MENIQTLFVIIGVVCLFGCVPLLGAVMPRDDDDPEETNEPS